MKARSDRQNGRKNQRLDKLFGQNQVVLDDKAEENETTSPPPLVKEANGCNGLHKGGDLAAAGENEKLSQPDNASRKVNGTQEINRTFVITSCQSPERLEFGEKILNQMTSLI